MVIAFDIAPPPSELNSIPSNKLTYVRGDLSDIKDVRRAFAAAGSNAKVECAFHIGALVGPYFKKDLYHKVNYLGSVNVADVAKECGCHKLVMSSSPSTRMDGKDIKWKREDELSIRPPGKFLEPYAETKAMGETYVLKLNDETSSPPFLTVAVAPHQVYGPWDGLFLTNFLKAANKLRVFGRGENMISMCHVDNYAHALILGYHGLYKGSPALGKFYIATDGPPVKLWDVLDHAFVTLGLPSVKAKVHIPVWFIMPIAYVVQMINRLFGMQMKLKPFSVRMLIIDRTFNIENIERDLKYKPLKPFEKAFEETLRWFDANRDFWGGSKK